MKGFLASLLIVASSVSIQAHEMDSIWVFTYGTSPSEGIHVAYSYDKQHWIPIGKNYSFVKSDFGAWGANKKMHNPSVLLSPNKIWYAVWAVNDHSPQFATTYSSDFWLWKPQDYPYMNHDENVQQPHLSLIGSTFVVTYKTGDGYRRTTSTDFSHWTTPINISEQEYLKDNNTEEVLVNGLNYHGQLHRTTSAFIDKLLGHVSYTETQNNLYNENCGQDAERFKGIDSLYATLTICPNQTKAISDKLVGIFFEDINYSADGGLYAELIQNRDFEYNSQDRGNWNAQSFWTLEGEGTEWTISTENPIHPNNAHYSLLTTTKPGASLVNNGFDGIAVQKGAKYDFSLFLKGHGSIVVRLLDGGKELAKTTFKASENWKLQKTVIKVSSSSKTASLHIEPQQVGTIAIDFVSLFPQDTFKGRKNGLRKDLAQTLADLHPRFVRFPGGCVSHGNGLDNMYHWNTTIGSLWERKTQSNLWGYHQSKGLGFYEYFQFCEDIGAEPLPVLPAAVPCQNSSRGGDGQQGGLPMEQMDDYVQELCDLIEWANGDSKTSKWAKMRAEAGHPKPFGLKMLGIGNEDLISDVFTERFTYIYRELQKRHPEITVVGTVGPFFEGSDYEYGWKLADNLQIPIVDEHYYVNPGWYIHNQQYYDKYPRTTTKVYLGEWASRGNRLENALAEAIHLCNLERNADVVTMSSYAPLLAKQGHTQWNPDLIYFNNTEVHPTVNYQVQRLFGNNSGSRYVNANLTITNSKDDTFRRLSESVVMDETTGDLILKLVNYTPITTVLSLSGIPTNYGTSNCKLSLIKGQPSDRNNTITESFINIDKGNYTMPAYSFSVIRIHQRQ